MHGRSCSCPLTGCACVFVFTWVCVCVRVWECAFSLIVGQKPSLACKLAVTLGRTILLHLAVVCGVFQSNSENVSIDDNRRNKYLKNRFARVCVCECVFFVCLFVFASTLTSRAPYRSACLHFESSASLLTCFFFVCLFVLWTALDSSFLCE